MWCAGNIVVLLYYCDQFGPLCIQTMFLKGVERGPLSSTSLLSLVSEDWFKKHYSGNVCFT